MAGELKVLSARGWAVAARGGDWKFFFSCALLLFLNLVDGSLTVTFLELGVAEEVNPLMRLAYGHSPWAFMGVKVAAVGTGVLMLWVARRARAARLALALGVAVYAVISAWHLAFLARLWAG